MGASNPAWLFAGLVSSLSSRSQETLRMPLYAYSSGQYQYLASIEGLGSDIIIGNYVRAGYLQSGADCCYAGLGIHKDGNSPLGSPHLFFPAASVKRKFSLGGRAVDTFFEKIETLFPGKKIYYYDAGDEIQIYINVLTGTDIYYEWLNVVKQLADDGMINDDWWALTDSTDIWAMRWSATATMIEPAMYKWHCLPPAKKQ